VLSALRRWFSRGTPAPALPAAPGPSDARAALAALDERARSQVPGQLLERIERISATIDGALPQAGQLGVGSTTYHALVRTATNYLPEAVDAYLALPRSYANHHVVRDGKTSLGLVCDQLDLLGRTIDEIVVDLRQADTDRIVINGRFLEDKFGTGALDLGTSGP
jgi:hypothetical protein